MNRKKLMCFQESQFESKSETALNRFGEKGVFVCLFISELELKLEDTVELEPGKEDEIFPVTK